MKPTDFVTLEFIDELNSSIAQMIRTSAALQVLDLSQVFPKDAPSVIIEALKTNKTITHLDMRGMLNVKALADVIATNKTLQVLDLRSYSRTTYYDKDNTAIALAMQQNTTLTTVDLRKEELPNINEEMQVGLGDSRDIKIIKTICQANKALHDREYNKAIEILEKDDSLKLKDTATYRAAKQNLEPAPPDVAPTAPTM